VLAKNIINMFVFDNIMGFSFHRIEPHHIK
jgi:hypothetical protein